MPAEPTEKKRSFLAVAWSYRLPIAYFSAVGVIAVSRIVSNNATNADGTRVAYPKAPAWLLSSNINDGIPVNVGTWVGLVAKHLGIPSMDVITSALNSAAAAETDKGNPVSKQRFGLGCVIFSLINLVLAKKFRTTPDEAAERESVEWSTRSAESPPAQAESEASTSRPTPPRSATATPPRHARPVTETPPRMPVAPMVSSPAPMSPGSSIGDVHLALATIGSQFEITALLNAAQKFNVLSILLATGTDVPEAAARMPLQVIVETQRALAFKKHSVMSGATTVAVHCSKVPSAHHLPEFSHPEKAVYVFAKSHNADGTPNTKSRGETGDDTLLGCDLHLYLSEDMKYSSIAAMVNLTLYDRLTKIQQGKASM